MKKLILLSMFFCLYKANSQSKGFIITKSKDTIYAEKIWMIDTDEIVKIKKNKKRIKFPSKDVEVVYNEKKNRYYEKVKLPFYYNFKRREEQFLPRYVNGKIKLFIDVDYGQVSDFYLLKDEKLKLLSVGSFKFGTEDVYKEVSNFVKDDNSILTELNSMKKLSFEGLKKLLQKYNSNFINKKKHSE